MKLDREKRTLLKMVAIYCNAKHHSHGQLCERCSQLSRYALERVSRCKFGADKPVCAQCPIHCYKLSMREEIKRVMRYAGPRMLFAHPLDALRHLLDSWRYRYFN